MTGASVLPVEVIAQYAGYQCSACGSSLQFDPCKITEISHAIAWCPRGREQDYDPHYPALNCRLWKVRLRIPITRIVCDREIT